MTGGGGDPIPPVTDRPPIKDPTDVVPSPPVTPKEHTHKEFDELRKAIAALEAKGTESFLKIMASISQIDMAHTHPELAIVGDLEIRITELENAPPVDLTAINARFDAMDVRFDGIDISIVDLQNTDITIQDQVTMIQGLVDSLTEELDTIKNPTDDGDETDPRFPLGFRIVYFTAPNLGSVKETDRMAKALKNEHGYPITIVTLTPEVDKTQDVPMLIVFPEERIVAGTSNCITYLSSLTF